MCRGDASRGHLHFYTDIILITGYHACIIYFVGWSKIQMSYQVLARKWRPRFFDEMVGQEHVLRALINSLNSQQLHHAYLFTGTRGVGKTTIARILAKCLNCEQGISARPCGECGSCIEISEGRFVDLIEVDAASRTRVEDTRELLENVQYAPSRGRFKVYLIDEVHMLSTHSFNALLKTLEEPPAHVKFLLATTDPQKLPITVLSRCLQFNLKNMPAEKIVDYLHTVLKAESVGYEEPALWQLGRASQGSMRDALSLTDQAIAYGEGQISEDNVHAMLGTMDRGRLFKIAEVMAKADASEVMAEIAEMAEHSPDYDEVIQGLLTIWHKAALAQAVPEAIDNNEGEREAILALAAAMQAEDLQLYYQIGISGRADLALAPNARQGFEMLVLRMLAFRPVSQAPADLDLTSSLQKKKLIEQPAAELNTNADVADEPNVEVETAHEPSSKPKAQPEASINTQQETQAEISAQNESASTDVEKQASVPIQPESSSVVVGAISQSSAAGASNTVSTIEVPVVSQSEPSPVSTEKHTHATVVESTNQPAQTQQVETQTEQHTEPAEIDFDAEFGIPLDAPSGFSEGSDPQDEVELGVLTIRDNPTVRNSEANGLTASNQQASSEATAEETETKVEVQLDELTVDNWWQWVDVLPLQGFTQSIASNLVLTKVEAGQYHFDLHPDQSFLFNESQQYEIEQALRSFVADASVIITKQVPTMESPAERDQRLAADARILAQQALETDTLIQRIVQEFDAQIIDSTIRPVS